MTSEAKPGMISRVPAAKSIAESPVARPGWSLSEIRRSHSRPVRRSTNTPSTAAASIAASVHRADQLGHQDDRSDLHDGRDDEEHECQEAHVCAASASSRGRSVRCAAASACRVRLRAPQTVTRHSASATMARFILLAPNSRSTNVIGTSARRSPLRTARIARSTWKQ